MNFRGSQSTVYRLEDYDSRWGLLSRYVEKVPGVMPNRDAEMANLRGVICFWKLDMLQGYWQMSLAAEAQKVFTIATPEGLFTATHVPQGVLNAMAYFRSVMTELLAGLNCKIWVVDIVWWGTDADDLLNTLDKILIFSLKAGPINLWSQLIY